MSDKPRLGMPVDGLIVVSVLYLAGFGLWRLVSAIAEVERAALLLPTLAALLLIVLGVGIIRRVEGVSRWVIAAFLIGNLALPFLAMSQGAVELWVAWAFLILISLWILRELRARSSD